MRRSIRNIWDKPTDIRGHLRPFYENYMKNTGIIDEAEKAAMFDNIEHARGRGRGRYGLNDHELDLLRRHMNKKMGGTKTAIQLNKMLSKIAHMREIQQRLIGAGDTKSAAKIGEIISTITNASDVAVVNKAMRQFGTIKRGVTTQGSQELIKAFGMAESEYGVALSTRKAMIRVGGTIGLGVGLVYAAVGVVGWAAVGAMKLASKANSVLTQIQRNDFGTGKALTTQMLATTNQRAIQQMQQNKFGARRWLGLEAQLVGR